MPDTVVGPSVARRFSPLRRWRRWLLAVVGLAIAVLAVAPGCGRFIGPKMVAAPNQGKSVEALGDLDAGTLARRGITRQLRVEVGPPKASLSLWVIDPIQHPVRVMTASRDPRRAWQFDQGDRPAATAEEPLGTILILHGIYDSKEKFGGFWGWIFAAAGYRAVVVDLRGHGRSTGDWMTYGVVEARDLSQVIDALEREGLVAGKIGVFGVSYGGAVGIQAAAIDPRIEAVATLAAFSSLQDVVYPFGQQVVTRRLGPWGWTMLRGAVPGAVSSAGRAAGFDPADASPRKAIARTQAPVLLIHGTSDQHVPYREAEALQRASQGRSTLVLIPQATHVSLILRRVSQVRRLTLQWFDHCLVPLPAQEPPTQPPTQIARARESRKATTAAAPY